MSSRTERGRDDIAQVPEEIPDGRKTVGPGVHGPRFVLDIGDGSAEVEKDER